jgi:hypothetical protein
MTETLFQLANLWIMPFWLLMIVLPHWSWTKRIMTTYWAIIPLAVAYALLVLPQVAGLLPALANPTLDSLAALLGNPQAAAVGWIHFLAFDLFVGRWIYLDSRERAISAWFVAPCLFFTLMLGPVGFLLYQLMRRIISAPQV